MSRGSTARGAAFSREKAVGGRQTGYGGWATRAAASQGPGAAELKGFTLIELMVVIAIMAIVMTISAPAIYHIWHKESLGKSVADIMESCARARERAIMQGTMAMLVFNADDGSFHVAGATAHKQHGDTSGPMGLAMPGASSGLSGKLPDTVAIAALKINGINYMNTDRAMVRFYPNGTCDELRLILLQPGNGDMRGIFLEITTGLASVDSDRSRLQSELK